MATKITVIGGGPGGYVAALRAAQLGGAVTLIEMENLGGTCLNWGCIPSKIMKHAGELLEKMRHASDIGIRIAGDVRFDLPSFIEHKEKVLATQRSGIASLLKRAGVEVIQGRARISGSGEVTVDDGQKIAWEKLIIAAGSVPRALPALPFDQQMLLSSNDLLSLDTLPDSLVIIGGGVIGCEFAFIFESLGVRVTVVEALSRILPLPTVDESVSKLILREMKKKKIAVHLDTVVTACGLGEEEGAPVCLIQLAPADPDSGKGKTATLIADRAALCVGRAPLTGGLGLEKIGLATDERGWVPVNDKLETAVSGVYAIGDILGPERVMLAHAASHEGMVAAVNAMGGDEEMDYRTIPGAIFTMPEAASVGLTEAQAMEAGLDYTASSVNLRVLGKAQAIGELAGEAKLIAKRGSGRLLGVHLTGAHATDLIAEASLALSRGLTVADLARTVHAHPTLSEILHETALKALGMPLHG